MVLLVGGKDIYLRSQNATSNKWLTPVVN